MKHILLLLTLLTTSIAYNQNKGFYLNVTNDAETANTTMLTRFATEVNEHEIIYLKNYSIFKEASPYSGISGGNTRLVRSTKDGDVIRELNILSDSLELQLLYAYRHHDLIVVNGTGLTATTSYFVSFTYDLDLNLLQSEAIYFIPRQEIYTKNMLDFPYARYYEGKLYILYQGGLDGAFVRYDANGNVEKFNKQVNSNIRFELRGYAIDPYKDQISATDGFRNYLFDLDFNYISQSQYPTNPDGLLDTLWAYYSSYIPINEDEYLAFGRLGIVLDEVPTWLNVLTKTGKNLRPTHTIHYPDFPIGDFSDGPPRVSGGLFRGSDGYYTIAEAVPADADFATANTFFVSKYDDDLEMQWERRFIFDDNARLFNYHAELTPDNSFLITGGRITLDPSIPWPYHLSGHIIGLRPDGNPSTLSTAHTGIKAIFSVRENPVSHDFIVTKGAGNTHSYTVRITDMTGRSLASSDRWNDATMSIDVSRYMPGAYVYTISDGSRIVYSGKFIKI